MARSRLSKAPAAQKTVAAVVRELTDWMNRHAGLLSVSHVLGNAPQMPAMVDLAMILLPLTTVLPELIHGQEPLKKQAVILMNEIATEIGRPMTMDEMNAVRHVVTAAIITRDKGPDAAYALGIINELQKDALVGQADPELQRDRSADLFNNYAGIMLGVEYPDASNTAFAHMAWDAVQIARQRRQEQPVELGDVVLDGRHLRQSFPQGHWAATAQQGANLFHQGYGSGNQAYVGARDQFNSMLNVPSGVDAFSGMMAAILTGLLAAQVQGMRLKHWLKKQTGEDRRLIEEARQETSQLQLAEKPGMRH